MGLLLTLLVFLGGLEGNVHLGPWLEWRTILLGSFLAQLLLLAAWGGLSQQPVTVRLPQALELAAVLSLAEAWISSRYRSGAPTDILQWLLAFLVSVLVLAALLTVFRRRYGWRIGRGSVNACPQGTGVQFSLKRLLAWITCIAVVLSWARWIGGEAATSDESGWLDCVVLPVYVLGFLAVFVPLLISCVGLVLGQRGRRKFGIWTAGMAAITFVLGTLATFLVYYAGNAPVAASELPQLAAESAITMASSEIGFLAVTLGSLAILRVCGYRLMRGSDPLVLSESPPTHVSVPACAAPPGDGAAMASGLLWWRSTFVRSVAALTLAGAALCWPAWILEQARREEAPKRVLAQELKRLGADVSIGDYTTSIEFPANQPVSDAVLKRLPELDKLAKLEHLVFCGRPLTDDQLQSVGGLQHLWGLALGNTRITDAGLVHLRGLKQLRELDLSGTRITAAGLAHLRGLERLEFLNLSRTRITDEGLRNLQQIGSLRYLFLEGTAITDAGVAHLRRMKKLETLHLGSTAVTKQAMIAFEKEVTADAADVRERHVIVALR